jgi:hypothetical protein
MNYISVHVFYPPPHPTAGKNAYRLSLRYNPAVKPFYPNLSQNVIKKSKIFPKEKLKLWNIWCDDVTIFPPLLFPNSTEHHYIFYVLESQE